MPGSRCVNGRIALNTWVTARTPRSNAACASAAVAFEWPSETTTPRAWRRSTRSSAPGKLGRERHRAGPARPRAGARAAPGRGRGDSEPGASRAGAGERNGPSRCTPRIRGPRARSRRGTARERGDEVGLLEVMKRRQVGRDARLEQRFAGRREPVGVRAEEVDAREAVHLQVDEPGNGDPATASVETDGCDDGRLDRDVPGRGGRRRAHASTPSLTARAPCGRRRRRPRAVAAPSRVDPGEQRHDRDLRVAAGRVERCVDLLAVGARGVRRRSAARGPGACRSSRRRRPSGCRTSCRGGPSRSSRSC